jgi:F-type H+-transporting ATPase subunit b
VAALAAHRSARTLKGKAKAMQTIIAQVLTTLLAFGIFFVIAKRLFWTSILKTIEDRQERIRLEFERIEELKAKVAQLEADYSRHLAQIEKEANQLKQREIAEGKRIAEEIKEQARREAEAELRRMQQVMAVELEKVKAKLKSEVVRLTLAATERIIRERLDDLKHRELISNFVEELSRK